MTGQNLSLPRPLIVDACVGVLWVMPDRYSLHAARLMDDDRFDLYAPDLWLSETGNALWKRARKGDLTKEDAIEACRIVHAANVTIVPSNDLAERAVRLAFETDRTVYDSLYIVLAVETGFQFVTADLKLYNALRDGHYRSSLVWIEEIDEGL